MSDVRLPLWRCADCGYTFEARVPGDTRCPNAYGVAPHQTVWTTLAYPLPSVELREAAQEVLYRVDHRLRTMRLPDCLICGARMPEQETHWPHWPGSETPRGGGRMKLEISTREIRLLREVAQGGIESFERPNERKDRQPPEWHESHELMALARKLEKYRRSKKDDAIIDVVAAVSGSGRTACASFLIWSTRSIAKADR